MVGEVMEIKYKDIEVIRNVVTKLFRQSLPVDVQYWLNRNVTNLANATKPYEEKRIELIKTNGIKDKKTGMYSISSDDKKFQELLDTPISVVIKKIEVNKLTNAGLTQAETNQIMFMLCEEKIIKTSSLIIN